MKTITDESLLGMVAQASAVLRFDGDPVRVLTDYSGRGMYGERCVAVVGDHGGFAAFVATLAQMGADLDADDPINELLYQVVNSVVIDSLGTDRVFYFPGVVAE